MFKDDLQGGLEHLEHAIALSRETTTHRPVHVGSDSRVACYTTAGFTLWLLGFPDRAVDRMNEAIALAIELEHPPTALYARFHSGLLHLWRREPEIVLERAGRLLEAADEFGYRIWTAAGSCLLGAAEVAIGRTDEGLANVRSGMAMYQDLRSPPVFLPMLLYVQASANLVAGRPEAGLEPLDAAIGFMEGTVMLPALHVLKGDLLLAGDPAGGAEALAVYRRAFERSTELDARTIQLQAALRLVRLASRSGDDAARRVLEDVYASFTEGFSTRDLIEARQALGIAE
jgi:hypothetical protein